MADELTYTLKLSVTKTGEELLRVSEVNQTADVAGSDAVGGTQSIGTAAEAVDLGDLSIAGALIYIKNIDATNFVVLSMASDATNPFSKLTPGQWAVFRGPATGTLYAKADTAAVIVLKKAVEA